MDQCVILSITMNRLDNIQSRTIDLLRFPLATMVVFIHIYANTTPIPETDYPLLSGSGIYNVLEIFLSNTFPRIAVPAFFFFSSFLFFKKLEEWDWRVYANKLNSRVKTLLVPYVLWILMSFFIIAIIPTLCELFRTGSWESALQVFQESRPTDAGQNVMSMKSLFWDAQGWVYDANVDWLGLYTNKRYPLVATLWFVRDLMVMMLLSPVIYWFLRKTKVYGLVALILANVFDVWPHITGISIAAVLFYSMGAYLAIFRLNMIEVARKVKYPAWAVAILSLAISTYYDASGPYGSFFIACYTISGVWCAISLASMLVMRYDIKPNIFLVRSCFFVYCLHLMPYDRVCNTPTSFFVQRVTSLFAGIPHTMFVQYIAPAILVIPTCLFVYYLLSRFCPSFSRLLTGNR